MSGEPLDEVAQAILAEVKAWADEHIVGQQSTESLRQLVPLAVRRQIADRLEVEPHEVELLNPRWEDEGRTFAFDGARLR